MAAAYKILGRSVPPHYLALATIGAVVFVVVPKPWAAKEAHPAIKASSPEEEKFVKDFIAKSSEKH